VAGNAPQARFELKSPNIVMAGLDPAIHGFLFTKQDVDARHKAGHDGRERTKAGSDPGLFLFVIASEAKQSIVAEARWIASSLRSSQ
jgi:hypothetical protein